MTEAMEYEDEQLVEEQLVEEPIEGEEDDFEDIEEEGDIAADYLEELLDIVDMDGDIDIEVRNNRIYCLLYTSPSPRDPKTTRMPSSA